MATFAQTAPFLPPIEKPKSLFMRLGYYFMRKKFGKVMTPARVFSARMPTVFTTFYGKVGKLDKKLQLPIDTVLMVRERVAGTNGCLFCVDATRARALERSVLPLLASGAVHVPIAAEFPLEEAVAAYDRFTEGGKFGKIVLRTGG